MKNINLIYNDTGHLKEQYETDSFYIAKEEDKSVIVKATFPAFLVGSVRAYIQFRGGGDVVECGSINLNQNTATLAVDAKYLTYNFLKIGFEVVTATKEIRFEPVTLEVDEFVNIGGGSAAEGYTVTVKAGNVVMLDAGEEAYVRNTGTAKDAVFEFGIPRGSTGLVTENGGEIFNDYENNKAVAPNSHTEGQGNTSGSKCFKFDLSHNYDAYGADSGYYYLTSVEGIETGLVYSIEMANGSFDFYGTVTEVDAINNRIKVDNYLNPNEEDYAIDEESYILFPYRPDLGTDIIGVGAHTDGIENKALADGSSSGGKGNVSGGKYSNTINKDNRAGYCADAGGISTHADAEFSFTRGLMTKVKALGGALFGGTSLIEKGADFGFGSGSDHIIRGKYGSAENKNNQSNGYAAHVQNEGNIADGDRSDAGGYETRAIAENTFTRGRGTRATRKNQAVVGEFNKIDNEALFIVGSGDGYGDGESNALTVKKSGQLIAEKAPTTPESLTNKKYVDEVIGKAIDTLSQYGCSFLVDNKPFIFMPNSTKVIGGKTYYGVLSKEFYSKEWGAAKFKLNSVNSKVEGDTEVTISVAKDNDTNYIADIQDITNFTPFKNYLIPVDTEWVYYYGTKDSNSSRNAKVYSKGSIGLPQSSEIQALMQIDTLSLGANDARIVTGTFDYNYGWLYKGVKKDSTLEDSGFGLNSVSNGGTWYFMTYVSEDFFTKTHLSVLQMGTIFKEKFSSIFNRENLSDIYNKTELNIIYNGDIYASLGDIETALDSIIAMQTNLIGGDAE